MAPGEESRHLGGREVAEPVRSLRRRRHANRPAVQFGEVPDEKGRDRKAPDGAIERSRVGTPKGRKPTLFLRPIETGHLSEVVILSCHPEERASTANHPATVKSP